MMQRDFDINKLSKETQFRWLKPVEVLFILQNHETFEITQKPPQKPPSGSLFLFNRRVLRYFRNDGHSWRKKRNGKTIREGHERLKIGNYEAINCYYAHGEPNSCFQRRSYWMLDPAFDHIVLVHYRDVIKGRHIPKSIVSSSIDSCPTLRYSTSVSNDQAQGIHSCTIEFNDPCQNSCSPGSVEEIISQVTGGNIKMSHLNTMDRSESTNQLLQSELSQALRKLEEQLSLDKDKDSFASSEEELPPFCNLNVETHNTQDETRSPKEEALQNPLDKFQQMSNGHNEDSLQYDNGLERLHGSLFPQSYATEADNYGANYSLLIQGTGETAPSAEISEFSSLFTDMWFDQSQFGAPRRTESGLTLAERHLFTIREVVPEWAFSSEPTKVIITGDFHCSPFEHTWTVLFGDIEVPLEIVQDGVFRCLTPQQSARKVKLCITSGNSQPCSEPHEFEFREKPEKASCSSTSVGAVATKISAELLSLVKFMQILFSSASNPQEDLELEVDPLRKLEGSKNRLEPIIEALLSGSMAPEKIMNAILQELLKDKLHQWLSFKHQGATEKDHPLSKQEQCIIHMISALGYQWALLPILKSGVCINYRDSNGWTALHWAASSGREEMVAALLAAGASAGVVTNPSAHDPAGKTPASLAAASGHKGLAGYLSEAALTSHLFSLTTERNERFEESAYVEVQRGVNSISERSAHAHSDGGTEDQLSLKDSLAAVRNAVQAAARIQAAFRAYSFRRKQQEAAICMSPAGVHELSVASRSHKAFYGFSDQKYEQAALSIQRNYQRWKRRKEFLQKRRCIVKIQAHVRGRLARENYKELLWSVGVLEKALLRWHRRGVGLRGFQAEPEYIDEEEDDIVKVLRRQNLDTAINEAVFKVTSVVGSPRARQQYRRMLESYQQVKDSIILSSPKGPDSASTKS
ncbi:calmodulin-binding transcription activator 4-like isoform X2 [Musa acuminata AAA Group]|uniref:calmodulin-binding transcription activator 4-like isoform X2 n=1 Tax=Musa acuminata AAA Group TaxID=214697 RepID=UPI0031DD92E5